VKIRTRTADPFTVLNVALCALAVLLCVTMGVTMFLVAGWAAWPGLLLLAVAGGLLGRFAVDLLRDRGR